MEVTAVFDIGKTNKKFILFDKSFNEVFRAYEQFDLTQDEEGHPAENLPRLVEWLKYMLSEIITAKKYNIHTINFSTYGASLVHIGNDGEPKTPMYNYTKELPEEIETTFFKKYGPKDQIETTTGSPSSRMLNSGLQLYWLKKTRPKLFETIRYSLHFPQYLSYVFTGIPLSEYTSVGCHTLLWDYEAQDYHHWVYEEGLEEKLASLVPTDTSINFNYHGKQIKIGVGVHDSSAALFPYYTCSKKPFILLSTGTWNVTMNPFSKASPSASYLNKGGVYYMQPDGNPVRSSRLFMGNEYKIQIVQLNSYFKVESDLHRDIDFDPAIYRKFVKSGKKYFHFEGIELGQDQPAETDLSYFNSFEEAYHKLMMELTDLQIRSTTLALGRSNIRRIYIDGGFAGNDIFIQLLSLHFKDYKIRITTKPLGSALGAAMLVSDVQVGKKFLKKTYGIKKNKPIVLQQ